MMFLVILRAIQLDSLQPWFRPPKTGVDRSGLKLKPGGAVDSDQVPRRTVTRRE
jgi:hypothetical protein